MSQHVHLQQPINPQMAMQPQVQQPQQQPGPIMPQQAPPGAQGPPVPQQPAPAPTQGQPPQQPQQQQQPQQPPSSQQRSQPLEDKLMSHVRKLVCGPLKEKWNQTLRESALRIYQNGIQDASVPGAPNSQPPQGKFENNLEDFHAICDQIELNLKCAIECMNQSSASNRYMPIPPNLSRTEMGNDYLTYPQYIATSKQQINFANDVRQMLNQAANDVVERNVPT